MTKFETIIVFFFAFMTHKAEGWTWTKTSDHPPGVTIPKAPKVSGHVAASAPSIANGSNDVPVFLFGGLTGPAGYPTTNELYEFSDAGGWRHTIEHKDQLPRQRMYSAASILQHGDAATDYVTGTAKTPYMYLFGGWDPGAPGSGGEFLKDIWKLDLITKEWTKLDVELPFPVSRHGACTVGVDKIVIHTYQGVLVFRASVNGEPETLILQETTGDGPDGLSMCAQAPLGNDGLVVIAGSTKNQQLSNTAYYLDTNTWIWSKLEVATANAPCARASPCAAAVAGRTNQVVVFGGASIGSDGYGGGVGLTPLNDAWLLTVNKWAGTAEWKKICSADSSAKGTALPEARLAATLTNIYYGGGKRMLLQGGYDSASKETFAEPWILKQDDGD